MVGVGKNSLLTRLLDRLLPKPPDFFCLLAEQSEQVCETMRNLHHYMETLDANLADLLVQNEHQADTLKIRNLHELNSSFSTPIDRDSIYRAIESMDWMVTHTKSTINEMLDLEVEADEHMRLISGELLTGAMSLQEGFLALSVHPERAEIAADRARHAHRRIERYYRHALAELFKGKDPVEMLRRREIYHHLMDGSRRLHGTANVLHDIMVQMV